MLKRKSSFGSTASDLDLEPTTSHPNPKLTGSNRDPFLPCKAKLHKPTAYSVTIPVATTEFDNSIAGAKLNDSIAIVIPFHKTLTSMIPAISALSSCKALDAYLYALEFGSL